MFKKEAISRHAYNDSNKTISGITDQQNTFKKEKTDKTTKPQHVKNYFENQSYYDSIKIDRHTYNANLSKDRVKWSKENPIPENALKVLTHYPKMKPVKNNSNLKKLSDRPYSIVKTPSKNNIILLQSKKSCVDRDKHKHNTSRLDTKFKTNYSKSRCNSDSKELNKHDGSSETCKVEIDSKASTKTDSSDLLREMRIRPQEANVRVRSFLFNKKKYEKKNFDSECDNINDDLDKCINENNSKSRVRFVEKKQYIEDESIIYDSDGGSNKVRSLIRRGMYSSSSPKDIGNSTDEESSRFGKQIISGNSMKKITDISMKQECFKSFSKSKFRDRLRITSKMRNYNVIKNMKDFEKYFTEANRPKVIEYNHPYTKPGPVIFTNKTDQEPSVCCIPWVKEKMKTISSEKKKAKKQMEKLFPLDRGLLINTDIRSPTLLTHMTSKFDANYAVDQYIKDHLLGRK